MYIMIIWHWAILIYNMSFKSIVRKSGGVFWWFPALSEDQDFFFFFYSPKLSCGFNMSTLEWQLAAAGNATACTQFARSCSKGICLNQHPVVRGVAKEMPVTPEEVTSHFYSVFVTMINPSPWCQCFHNSKINFLKWTLNFLEFIAISWNWRRLQCAY